MSLSGEIRRRIIIWLMLAAILTGASLHRVNRYKDRPLYYPASGIEFFYTEEAFQYRYTRMVANNEAIPLLDKKAQWPEGIAPFRELTLFQEHLHGMAFRLFSVFFGDVPLRQFLVWFVPFFSSLAVLAVFLGARAIGVDEWAALFCSALYAFTGSAFARTKFYELESTAFPLMALSFAACLNAFCGQRYIMTGAVISGCLLAAALNSWLLTRFYLLIFWVAMSVAFLLAGGNQRRIVVAGVILLLTAVAGLLSPVMRNSTLLYSPAIMAGGLVVAGLYYDDKYSLNFLSRLALLMAGAILIAIMLSLGVEEHFYGHAWDLLKYKLSNFLIKPADPADLPFEGRIIWNGPFNTMSLYDLFYGYGLLLPLALAGLVRFIKRQQSLDTFSDIMVFSLAVMFLFVSIMLQRLSIFGAFFLGLATVYFFYPHRGEKLKMTAGKLATFPFLRGFHLSWIVLAACLIFQIREAVLYNRTFFAKTAARLAPPDSAPSWSPVYVIDEVDMLVWIRGNTPEKAVFLANNARSASILTYTGRAINLHPKIETESNRKKCETALFTIFGENEEALYRLFDSFETDYYLYSSNDLLYNGPDGERYLAGISKVPRNSLIYRLHFEPNGFRRLRLVYRNRSYQIYQVMRAKTEETIKPGYAITYFPVYDPQLFDTDKPVRSNYFDDTRVGPVLEQVGYSIHMMVQAEKWLSKGDQSMTTKLIEEALTVGLPDGYTYYRAAEYMVRLDNLDQAFAYIRKALIYDPGNTKFKKLLAQIQMIRHKPFNSSL